MKVDAQSEECTSRLREQQQATLGSRLLASDCFDIH